MLTSEEGGVEARMHKFPILVIQVEADVVLVGTKKIKAQEGWMKMMPKKCINRWV